MSAEGQIAIQTPKDHKPPHLYVHLRTRRMLTIRSLMPHGWLERKHEAQASVDVGDDSGEVLPCQVEQNIKTAGTRHELCNVHVWCGHDVFLEWSLQRTPRAQWRCYWRFGLSRPRSKPAAYHLRNGRYLSSHHCLHQTSPLGESDCTYPHALQTVTQYAASTIFQAPQTTHLASRRGR